jgi:hypothetical protein
VQRRAAQGEAGERGDRPHHGRGSPASVPTAHSVAASAAAVT